MSRQFINTIFMLAQVQSFILADIAVLDSQNKSVELFIDYKISYTPPIPEDGIYGALTLASPLDACGPISTPPSSTDQLNQTINWFVLAYRSSSFHAKCSNREKIQNAVNAGYKAIILYSPMDFYQTSFIHSSSEHFNITIPGLLVSHEDGQTLRSNFLYHSGFRLFITSEIPPNFSYYLIPFAIIIGAGILIIVSYVVFQLMMCIMERRKAQRHRLSRKDLKKVTLQKFEKGIFYETCAICLDDYVEGEKIRILPCNHAYHMKCIDPWLTKNRRVCPVCKAKVKLPGMEEYSDSDSDNDNQRSNRFQQPNERTQLLPSSSSSNRSSNPTTTMASAAGIPNSASSNTVNLEEILRPFIFRNLRQSRTSTIITTPGSRRNRYTNIPDLLDDSTIRPGPSTSAPIISAEISSQQSGQQQISRIPSSSGFNRSRQNRRRNQTNLPQPQSQLQQLSSSSEHTPNVVPNVQIVIADLHSTTSPNIDQQKQQQSSSSSVLIAPPQLSINCDSSDMDDQRSLSPDQLSINENRENRSQKPQGSRPQKSSSTINEIV
ncbi:E3 ubiquitin-protein ligase RNF13-like [Dermatophagoides pteronyssinus]|uniref:E3 ubiquitin-protein ligase RNF13-like n=1 Tax=Dermatophagoides pteronyssinus TaxID=6956 RepID=A0A6P6XXE2_DERPT|nr:E3 ubiquitin-protein ligase RNF13-like [Dermatophagoides pteronyssinus]